MKASTPYLPDETAAALAAAAGSAAQRLRQITFSDNTQVPVLGQGTWRMGEQLSERAKEIAALRLGLELGLRFIDCAELYADGGAEQVVGEAITGRRELVFLSSKVSPGNASSEGVTQACERSLRRLKTEYLDLYLLHRPSPYPIAETVAAFEQLQQQGKIRRWGVSNFDLAEMQQLPPGCAANELLYNPSARGIEFDLLPWLAQQKIPLIAHRPIGLGSDLLRQPCLLAVAQRHGVSPAQIALAWALRQSGVLVITKTIRAEHLHENLKACALQLSAEDLAQIDQSYPPPQSKQVLQAP